MTILITDIYRSTIEISDRSVTYYSVAVGDRFFQLTESIYANGKSLILRLPSHSTTSNSSIATCVSDARISYGRELPRMVLVKQEDKNCSEIISNLQAQTGLILVFKPVEKSVSGESQLDEFLRLAKEKKEAIEEEIKLDRIDKATPNHTLWGEFS